MTVDILTRLLAGIRDVAEQPAISTCSMCRMQYRNNICILQTPSIAGENAAQSCCWTVGALGIPSFLAHKTAHSASPAPEWGVSSKTAA
jgi:hypothetical protein